MPVGDHGVLVEFATEIGDAAHAAVLALDRAVADADIAGVVETVPAFVNILVDFDPLVTVHAAVEASVRSLLTITHDPASEPRRHTILTCYDLELGRDLAAVAESRGLSIDATIDAHLAGDYRVFMYGFAPGYAYLAGVSDQIQVPRKDTAVRGVPTGSVMIAGPQCLITTIEMPTGWSVLGRSPTEILLADPDRPFLFDVGDHVTFERIDRATFDRLHRGEQP